MKKKKDKIYCWNCGKINNKKDRYCTKCNALLKRREHPFIKWLCGEELDDIKGNLFQKICQMFIDCFRLHLYGMVVGLALAFTIAMGINHYAHDLDVPKTNEDYRIINDEDTIVEDVETSPTQLICEDGYTLTNGKCYKQELVNAIATLTCPSGYNLDPSNNYCYSQELIEPTIKYYCLKELQAFYDQYNDGNNYGGAYAYLKSYLDTDNTSQKHYCYYQFYRDNDVFAFESRYVALEQKTCPSGTKGDAVCRREISATTTYTCNSGYTLTTDHKCFRMVEQEPIKK